MKNDNDSTVRKKRVGWLLLAGLVVVAATVAFASDNAEASPNAFVDHCHSSSEDLAWCEWIIFMEDPDNAAWFHWVTAPKPVAYSVPWPWNELRLCEAPDWAGGWQANTGNGYYGGLQFALSSWRAVGGTGYPHQHSPEEQVRRGQMLQKTAPYWDHWPTCRVKVGLPRR